MEIKIIRKTVVEAIRGQITLNIFLTVLNIVASVASIFLYKTWKGF